jgi:DNA polymerase III subunit delta'
VSVADSGAARQRAIAGTVGPDSRCQDSCRPRLVRASPADHFPHVSIVPLYGHEALRARLSSAIKRGALPASLLLHGPRGVGKQRLALWLAQTLVCASPAADATACGKCQACRYASALGHPDVHWFFPRPRLDTDATPADVVSDYADAIADRLKTGGLYAGSSGSDGIYVATVRAIVQAASVSPAMGRRKVFIIGDAERMVPQEGSDMAANALLKFLEEPPSNTFIILTSSEPGALLPTIRSRVVHVRVPPLPAHNVEAFLADPLVVDALKRGTKISTADRIAAANGAPGTLLESSQREVAITGAERLLESALSGDRAKTIRAAMAQGSTKARGAFSDTLDELTTLLAARARSAVARGDDRVAMGASRAIASVEQAKTLASGNVSPALITASLLRELTAALI